jgi:FAD/FMN-containing dehydrogenase
MLFGYSQPEPCHSRQIFCVNCTSPINKCFQVYGDRVFQNWGESVRNTPLWTFVPKTVLGLQNLVKWAKVHEYRVRCSGYRHSWSSTFSQDKQILISLLNLEQVTRLPDPMSIESEHIDPGNELKTIQLAAPSGVAASSADKALVRVGVAVTNEEFRRWAVANDAWTMPVDVILVE